MVVLPDDGKFKNVTDKDYVINGHHGHIQDLAFSPFFDNILATASSDCSAKLWVIPEWGLFENLDHNKAHSVLKRHTKPVMFCKWNPQVNFTLATTSMDQLVKIWNIDHSKETYSMHLSSNPWSLEWNHDGQILSCITKDKSMYLVDPRTKGKGLWIQSMMPPQKSIKMKWLGNTGKMVILSSNSDNSGRSIKIYDMRSFLSGPVLERRLDNHSYDSDIHYVPEFNLLFVINRGQTFFQYF